MSKQIEVEVWQAYPRLPLTPSQFILLLRLADSAGDGHRMVWMSSKTLMHFCKLSRSTIFAGLKRLKELCVIADVPDEEWPREAHRYESVVRRIRPARHWLTDTVDDLPGGWTGEGGSEFWTPGEGVTTPDEVVTPGGPNFGRGGPNFGPKVRAFSPTQGQGLKEPSVLVSSLRAAPTELPAPSSQRSRPTRRGASDDDLDPAKVFGLDNAPEHLSNNGGQKPKVNPDSAKGLALYFGNAVADLPHEWGVAPVNIAALAKNFSNWIREGVTTIVVRACIDVYVADATRKRTDIPAWKEFLTRRDQLLETVRASTPVTASDLAEWGTSTPSTPTQNYSGWSRTDPPTRQGAP